MNWNSILILLIFVSIGPASLLPIEELDSESANEFLNDKRSIEISKRFFFRNSKEQQKEAREKYEEKCERKLLNAALNKPRWCPPLESWPAWNDAVIRTNNKYSGKQLTYNDLVPSWMPLNFASHQSKNIEEDKQIGNDKKIEE